MKYYSVLISSISALVLGLFFAIASFGSPQFSLAGIPVSLACFAIAMLGGAVFPILKNQDDRLRRLEERNHVAGEQRT